MAVEDSFRAVLATGAVGGAAPHWVNLAARFRSEGVLPLDALGGELVAMLMLAVLGAVVVAVFKEKTMLKALFLGVSAPAFVLNLTSAADHAAQQSPRADSTRTAITLVKPWFVQSLYALGQPDPDHRALTVKSDVPVSGSVFIRGAASGVELEITVDDDGTWTVPTSEFSVDFRGMRENRVPIETPVSTVVQGGVEPVVLQLHLSDPEQTFLGGLLDGLGFDAWAQTFVRSKATIEVSSP